MSRNRDAKQLAEENDIAYVHALRLVREAREQCKTTTHLDEPCGPYCVLRGARTRADDNRPKREG